MKWFKHHTDESDREFMKTVLDQFGHEGYTVYYQIQEVLGIEIEAQLDAFERGRTSEVRAVMTIGLDYLSTRCKSTPDFIKRFAVHCRKVGRFSQAKLGRAGTEITIELPNLLDDSDEYLMKSIRRICKDRGLDPAQVLKSGQIVRTNSGHTPDTVRPEQSRADNSRSDKRSKAESSPPGDAGAVSPGARGHEGERPPSPTPSPPPSAAAVAAASPSDREAAVSSSAERLELPNPTFGLLLLLPLGLDPKAARGFSESIPLREIAAVARESGREDVQDRAAWARRALERRWKRDAVFSLQESTSLLLELEAVQAGTQPPPRPSVGDGGASPGKPVTEFGKHLQTLVASAAAKVKNRNGHAGGGSA